MKRLQITDYKSQVHGIFGMLLLVATSCGSGQTGKEVQPLPVKTLTVAASQEIATATYVGVVEESSSATLSFPVGGTIARTLADEGQYIRKGQLIAELDPTSAAQTFAAAEATYRQALDARDRLQQLHDANSLADIKWVEVNSQYRQAEAALEIARKNLADCKMYAPFTGVIGRKIASTGEMVMPGSPVMTLLEIGSVKVRFAVPEQEIASLRTDSRVEVAVSALGGRTFNPIKIEKGVDGNVASHSYVVRATVENGDRALLPGMVCRVSLMETLAAGNIVIPTRAVQQCGAERFVWTVENGFAAQRKVTTGQLIGNDIVVTDGLHDGDCIVVDGTQMIGEGTKVVAK